MPNLTIKFSTQEELEEFATWMCEMGEQDYWTWMDCDPNRPSVTFDYHTDNIFIKDNIINTTPYEKEA